MTAFFNAIIYFRVAMNLKYANEDESIFNINFDILYLLKIDFICLLICQNYFQLEQIIIMCMCIFYLLNQVDNKNFYIITKVNFCF